MYSVHKSTLRRTCTTIYLLSTSSGRIKNQLFTRGGKKALKQYEIIFVLLFIINGNFIFHYEQKKVLIQIVVYCLE